MKSIVLLAIAGTAGVSFGAQTITFDTSEVDMGQDGGTNIYGFPTTEWSAFGITMSNVYLYQDFRDWGPDFNGVANLDSTGGNIYFTNAADNLSVKWVSVQSDYYITSYDSSGAILEAFFYGSNGDLQLGTTTFTIGGIAFINFHDGDGLVTVSEMTFAAANVIPLPSGAGLAGLGLMAAAARRRRQM